MTERPRSAQGHEQNDPDGARAIITSDEFWRCVEAHIGWLHVQLKRLGVAERDLADMTQEALVAVHARWTEYDRERPIRPWLMAFAARVASNYRRRADVRREHSGLMDSIDEAFAHPSDPPDEAVAAAQGRALVIAALDSMGEDRRAVFVAAEIEGMSMPDITRGLGIPLNTGYTRLRLARADFADAVARLRAGRRQ